MDHTGDAEKAIPWTPATSNPAAAMRLRVRAFVKDRFAKRVKLVGLACLVFIVYAQWTQITSSDSTSKVLLPSAHLSTEKLQEDLQVCSKLRSKPTDPIGLGRERNARYIDGHRPTLIKNATVWVGEPKAGTSPEDARKGKGFEWITADVLLEHGLIKKVERSIDKSSLAPDTLIYDAEGRQLTTGIIDMHSHGGVDNQPELWGFEDTNEMSSDITPYVRSIDGLDPNDYQLQVIKSGGVTTSLVLPGSGNNIGGEAFVIKHAIGKADGRNETSATDMLADPARTWRYIKMACGENPKRVYGKIGEHGPVSRLGESWVFRHAFEQAARLVREQDDWCAAADSLGVEQQSSYLPQDLEWETLGAVLRGQVHVNTHCYTIPDLEAFVDHTNEFKFAIRAFHHAHQTYLVPEILKRAWNGNGGGPPASALFADNMFYKAEASVGTEFAGKILYEQGLTPIYVSDNPVLNAQHVVFEAAKAFGYGLPYHAALASVTTAPAERLGLGERLGKVKPGYDADVVVWDSDPMSVGATPLQVWIDGTAQFDDGFKLDKPRSGPIGPDNAADAGAAVITVPPATIDEPVTTRDVIFYGVRKSFLGDDSASQHPSSTSDKTKKDQYVVVVRDGKITCTGTCESALAAALASSANVTTVHLDNGYITRPFTAIGSAIGLNAIDAESTTDNGGSPETFSRGLDGLALGSDKLHYAHRYGVTRAISAPSFDGLGTHQGTSVGFRTGGRETTAADKGVVFAEDAAVHYTLDHDAKSGSSKSISGAVGALRHKLLAAVAAAGGKNSTEDNADPFNEAAYLQRVVAGDLALAITIHSADGIASLLRVKKTVDEAIAKKAAASSSSRTGTAAAAARALRLVVLGGAEAHLVARHLAAADVGVVLRPLNSYRSTWDQRRALVGAPLNDGTSVERLVAAGVTTAIGLEEDWLVRDVGLLAGIAARNSGGVIGEELALELVGGNIYKMLGLGGGNHEKEEKHSGVSEFVVFEGSPLEVGSRVRAVANGLGKLDVYEYEEEEN
ncbi:N-acetylglucosamine-6-phosphate deacetylase [Microdochium nivale]|nr:N-acetylglucosamine-6-phosphate deacetylase [Microdochium nivale]